MADLSKLDGYIWLDNEFVKWSQAKVHVLTHSLHYGLGVFEGIRSYKTTEGKAAVFRLPEHCRRLIESAKILNMNIDYSIEQLSELVVNAVKKNNLTTAYIRPLYFYGAESIGLRASGLSTHLMIAAWNWGKYMDEDDQKKGIAVKTSSFTRHHVNVTMCRAKCSGHYVNSMLALNEALSTGFKEALLLDNEGYVAEGTGENIFVVRDNILHTPDLTSCLDGITRKTVFHLAESENLEIRERRITRDEVYVADEAFFTGTAAEIVPISSLDRRIIGNGKPGPITTKLQKKYFDAVAGKIAEYNNWLTYV